MENKEYQLMCTYLKRKFYISTIYRKASTIEPMWFFETIAWEWDDKNKARGAIVEIDDSGLRFSALRSGGLFSTTLDTKNRTSIIHKIVNRSTSPRLTQNRCWRLA